MRTRLQTLPQTHHTTMKLSEIHQRTGLSLRYWQRRAARGEIPNTKVIRTGKRRIFLVQVAGFDDWWNAQLKEVNPWQPRKT